LIDLASKKFGGELNALLRTTCAFTQIEGTRGMNVIPPKVSCIANLRLIEGDTKDSAIKHLKKVISDPRIEIEAINGNNPSVISRTDTEGYKKIKVGIVPVEWEAKQMKNICEINRGGSPRPIEDFLTDEENGINCEKTKVGDRYVLENMLENDCAIGGEQSGHIIFRDYASTGEGELSALKLLCIMKETGRRLSDLADEMTVFPQTLINVRVSDFGKVRFPRDEEIKKAIAAAEAELGDNGRVLVRVSGTEPLVRVMIEGKDEAKINILAQEIAQVVKERLL
jgi:hypothetical protein